MANLLLPDMIAARSASRREDRSFTTSVEMRDDGAAMVSFDGVASTVDSPYMVRDMFGEFEETIARGAFNKTLKEADDVRLLVNHEGVPLARTKSGTLTLSARPDLRARAQLDPANPTVQEVRSAMSRGDLDQMSIGMRVTRQEWNEDYTQRYVNEVQLFDVSIVTYPANPTTTAALRSLDELLVDFDRFDESEIRRAIDSLRKRLPVPPPRLDAYWDKVVRRAYSRLEERAVVVVTDDDDDDDCRACLTCGHLCDACDNFCENCGAQLPAPEMATAMGASLLG